MRVLPLIWSYDLNTVLIHKIHCMVIQNLYKGYTILIPKRSFLFDIPNLPRILLPSKPVTNVLTLPVSLSLIFWARDSKSSIAEDSCPLVFMEILGPTSGSLSLLSSLSSWYPGSTGPYTRLESVLSAEEAIDLFLERWGGKIGPMDLSDISESSVSLLSDVCLCVFMRCGGSAGPIDGCDMFLSLLSDVCLLVFTRCGGSAGPIDDCDIFLSLLSDVCLLAFTRCEGKAGPIDGCDIYLSLFSDVCLQVFTRCGGSAGPKDGCDMFLPATLLSFSGGSEGP